MCISGQGLTADTRVRSVSTSDDELTVGLMDGHAITAPLVWYPRLATATPAQRARWEVYAGGYGVHWPDVDENLSTEGPLLGRPAPQPAQTAPAS
jgi:hypothetical protein